MRSTIQIIEKCYQPAWRGSKNYKYTEIRINNGSAEIVEKDLRPTEFKALLDEGGWFKGTRKFLDRAWPYMFRFSDVK